MNVWNHWESFGNQFLMSRIYWKDREMRKTNWKEGCEADYLRSEWVLKRKPGKKGMFLMDQG